MIIKDLIQNQIQFAIIAGDSGEEKGVYCLVVNECNADRINAHGNHSSRKTRQKYAHRDLNHKEVLELRELTSKSIMKVKGHYNHKGTTTIVYVPANSEYIEGVESNRITTVNDYLVK